jgi:RNA polymerase sigma factor (sigma-70 family)
MRCGTTFSCLSATPGGATAGQERDERDRASERLAELLGRVARRDRDAFRSLYEATSARLYGVAIGLLHDRARAEEVLQEAYVRIWQRAAEFDATIARPMTWLISIVRHRAIDLLRAERHERETTSSHWRRRRTSSCNERSRPRPSTRACAICHASSGTPWRWRCTAACRTPKLRAPPTCRWAPPRPGSAVAWHDCSAASTPLPACTEPRGGSRKVAGAKRARQLAGDATAEITGRRGHRRSLPEARLSSESAPPGRRSAPRSRG